MPLVPARFGDRRRFAIALCERDDAILLVRRQAPAGGDYWTVPLYNSGGRRFPTLEDDLAEETGLQLLDWEGLRYFVQVLGDDATPESLMFGVGLAVDGAPRDETAQVFLPRAEAMRRLAAHPDRVVREPALCYLERGCDDEVAWAYRRTNGGDVELLARLG